MREIEFRGKRLDNGEWAYGCLAKYNNERYILEFGAPDHEGHWCVAINRWAEVDPTTVGQFTGLCDKNGKKIYEGDILGAYGYSGVVKFGIHEVSNGWYVEYDKDNGEESGFAELNESWSWKGHGGEVIGNIHDNPELLEVRK